MPKKFSTYFIAYLILGLIFAIGFALFYRWSPLSYLSPGFYGVVLTWPYQAIGFTHDLMYYGLAGRPI